jgi:hypothetical protein
VIWSSRAKYITYFSALISLLSSRLAKVIFSRLSRWRSSLILLVRLSSIPLGHRVAERCCLLNCSCLLYFVVSLSNNVKSINSVVVIVRSLSLLIIP